jgi:hypothetical protein
MHDFFLFGSAVPVVSNSRTDAWCNEIVVGPLWFRKSFVPRVEAVDMLI